MNKLVVILLLALAAFTSACNNDSTEDSADLTPSLAIVAQDSNYLITLTNFTINENEQQHWTLDAVKLSPKALGEGKYSIPSKQVAAGKHTLSLVQGTATIQGTLYKISSVSFVLKERIPHRSDLFTEGFFFDNDYNLWESSGLDGKSKIFKMRWNGSKWTILDSLNEQEDEFGEGISLLNGELVHLYWKNQYLKTLNTKPLKVKSTIPFEGEGWGLCSAGKDALWVSNGSSQLRKIQIKDNKLLTLQSINVTNELGPVINLNELEEYNDKYVWANIWQSDHIVLIDMANGAVVADLDLTSLAVQERNASFNAEVLNGIAWHKQDQTLWVTGKYWKNIYILKLTNLP